MRYYFAPMEGVTNYLYRQAHHRLFGGVDRYYLPFLTPTREHLITPRQMRDIAPEHNSGIAVVPQLLTRSAEDFLWAAGELKAMGYDEVNLNLGCPSGTVTAKGKGAGALADPAALDRFLDTVFSKTPVAVSVKTRLGISSVDEFEPLAELYNRYPICELTIHPRLRQDFYKAGVRMDAFARFAPQMTAPLCYNGDLCSAADCAWIARRFPAVHALMLGRALVADGALLRRMRGGKGMDAAQLRQFHDTLFAGDAELFHSERIAMMHMKELWPYWIAWFPDGARMDKRIRKATDAAVYRAAVGELFTAYPMVKEIAPLWRVGKNPFEDNRSEQ